MSNFQLYHSEINLVLLCQFIETTVRRWTCRSTRTHFPDSEPTNLYSYSLVLSDEQRISKNVFYSLQFDPTGFEPTLHSTLTNKPSRMDNPYTHTTLVTRHRTQTKNMMKHIRNFIYLFKKRKSASQAISEISGAQFVPIGILIVF